MADRGPLLGTTLELEIGHAAHGGSCVARHEGRAIFVRHTLPGERVRAVVTDDRGGSYCFADAVEVLQASADRVEPPCPYARPGRCGGCDWQHAAGDAQLAIKTSVVLEQFRRIAHLDVSGIFNAVKELPGGLLGWRTRNVYAVDAAGRPGLRRHRSREIEHVDRCLIGVPSVGDAEALHERWPGVIGVEVVADGTGGVAVLGHRPGSGRQARGRRPPDRVEQISGPASVRHRVLGREFQVAAGGFWQVHPHAAETFAAALLDAVQLQPGESVLDLYAGAGALTAACAGVVGTAGAALGLESDRRAVEDAAMNLAELPQAEVRRARVTAEVLAALDAAPDVVVLDPPRAGAGREVMTALLELRPRAVGYVACDPAALARDVATAVGHGWRLAALRAFDAFPMTHHIECLALLEPAEQPQ